MSQTTTTARFTTMRYAIQYTTRDRSVPELQRTQMLTGRGRSGAEEVVTFATLEAAENAASRQRAEGGVLWVWILPVVRPQ